MWTLAQNSLVPLAAALVIGLAVAWWYHKGRRT